MTTSIITTTLRLGGVHEVPRIGYGAMQLAGRDVIGLPDDVHGAIDVLRQAVHLGVRFFDTANAYGPRTVNQIIGRALSPFDDDVVIGNKVGASRGSHGEWVIDGRPETIRAQVDDALLDMRTDASVLTYLRLPGDDPRTVDQEVSLEESLGALVELHEQGKVRHIGLSGASAEILERARRITPIAAVQNRFNLTDRSGVGVLAACERHGIAFVPYFPLATGNVGEVPELRAIATRLHVPTTTIALAWLLRRSPVIVPIPGTKSTSHLRDNLGAATIAELLTTDEVARLSAAEDENTATLATIPRRTG